MMSQKITVIGETSYVVEHTLTKNKRGFQLEISRNGRYQSLFIPNGIKADSHYRIEEGDALRLILPYKPDVTLGERFQIMRETRRQADVWREDTYNLIVTPRQAVAEWHTFTDDNEEQTVTKWSGNLEGLVEALKRHEKVVVEGKTVMIGEDYGLVIR